MTTRNGQKFVAGEYNDNTRLGYSSLAKIYKVDEYAVDKVTEIFEINSDIPIMGWEYHGHGKLKCGDKLYTPHDYERLALFLSVSEHCSLNAIRCCDNVVQLRSRQTEPIFTVSNYNKFPAAQTISSIVRLDYLPGKTGGEFCHKERINYPDFLVILRDISQALIGIGQARVIHRDVKPDNIIYTPEKREATLIDFNISIPPEWSIALLPKDLQILFREREEIEMGIIGSPSYLSPEQARKEVLTLATDHFSLGITAVNLLLGKRDRWDNNDTTRQVKRKDNFYTQDRADFDIKEYQELLIILQQEVKTKKWPLQKTLEGLESVLHPEPKQRDIAFLKECTIADLRKVL